MEKYFENLIIVQKRLSEFQNITENYKKNKDKKQLIISLRLFNFKLKSELINDEKSNFTIEKNKNVLSDLFNECKNVDEFIKIIAENFELK